MSDEQGYVNVFQDDGSRITLPITDYEAVVARLNDTRLGPTGVWEGVAQSGGRVWIRLSTVTCVLEVTPEMVAEDQERQTRERMFGGRDE